MSEDIEQSGVFPRLWDMQKDFNAQFGKLYDELRRISDQNAEQNTKIMTKLEQVIATSNEMEKRLAKTEAVKHQAPCAAVGNLQKDIDSQREKIEEIQDVLKSTEQERQKLEKIIDDIRSNINKIQDTLEKMEKEKLESKKTWKDVSIHIAKYILVVATGGVVFLLVNGLSNYLATLKGN